MLFLRQLFSDDKGLASSRIVLNFVGVVVGSITVLYEAFNDKLTGDIFGLYILATGGVYGFGKFRDSQVEIERVKAENPSTSPMNDVNIKAQGDVNVSKDTA